jgi:hypothetical protein
MTPTDWEVLIAIAGTLAGVLAALQQGREARPALRSFSLLCIVLSGAFTLRALSLKRTELAEERHRAAELELRLERASRTVEDLGNRLRVALGENSKLLASLDSMRHDLTAMRTTGSGGVLPPQYVTGQSLDHTWHGNTIRIRLSDFSEVGPQDALVAAYFSEQASRSFPAGPLRDVPHTASIVLLNVRPADMNAPTFKLISGDVTTPLTLGERFIRGRVIVVASQAFAHGDTIVIAPAEGKARFWIRAQHLPEMFNERNPNAALEIAVH